MRILIYKTKAIEAKKEFEKILEFVKTYFKKSPIISCSDSGSYRIEITGILIEIRYGDLNNLRGLKPDYIMSDTDWIGTYLPGTYRQLNAFLFSTDKKY